MPEKPLITEVLGVTNPSDQARSVREAHETLTGQPNACLTGGLWDVSEIRYALNTVRDLTGKQLPLQAKCADTLVHWPTYETLMDAHGIKGDGSANALMIGSISPLSSRAFKCLAEEVYGAKTAIVVDPMGGPTKARHGHFVYGSGLDLPFRSGSIDFVHTNFLLHMLQDPGSTNTSEKRNVRKLMGEVARVLAPGGQLLMREIIKDRGNMTMSSIEAERTQLCGTVVRQLGQHGIKDIATRSPVKDPLLDFLYDSELNNRQQKYTPALTNYAAFALYAKKPASRKYTTGSNGVTIG